LCQRANFLAEKIPRISRWTIKCGLIARGYHGKATGILRREDVDIFVCYCTLGMSNLGGAFALGNSGSAITA